MSCIEIDVARGIPPPSDIKLVGDVYNVYEVRVTVDNARRPTGGDEIVISGRAVELMARNGCDGYSYGPREMSFKLADCDRDSTYLVTRMCVMTTGQDVAVAFEHCEYDKMRHGGVVGHSIRYMRHDVANSWMLHLDPAQSHLMIVGWTRDKPRRRVDLTYGEVSPVVGRVLDGIDWFGRTALHITTSEPAIVEVVMVDEREIL
jgi:hypothetical protein